MTTIVCKNCSGSLTAEIKDLSSYGKYNVPVWYCSTCELSYPTLKRDRYTWVDEYKWDPPGFIYGNRASSFKRCLACGTDTIYAASEFLVTEYFPYYEAQKPAWNCCNCGFSDKVAKEDGYLWAGLFDGWLSD